MKKVVNRITRNLFGVDYYPKTNNLVYTPKFKTFIPKDYKIGTKEFNEWSNFIFNSINKNKNKLN